jgi:stearoyl-CoA desaturase (delta-9 desaturase)
MKPSVTINDPSIRAEQRRFALFTICVPFLGVIAALWLVFRNGIGVVEISLLAAMFILTTLGVEVGLHRLFTHNAFVAKPALRVLLAVLGSMAAQGSLLYWVAGHRRHHIHSDTGSDPHSPHIRSIDKGDEPMSRLKGLWHAHIGWMVNDNVTNCTLFARDINRDPMLRVVTKLYIPIVLLGLVIPAVIGGLWTGTWMGALNGFIFGGLVRMFLVHHSSWSNASFSHVFGGRPFNTGDLSANNLWFAIPTFGASLQNNHHAFPNTAYLGLEWWQIDIGRWFIQAFIKLGLASDMAGMPSADKINAKRR